MAGHVLTGRRSTNMRRSITQKELYLRDVQRTIDTLGITHEDYKLLRNYSKSLHRIYERQCNGYPDVLGNWDAVAEAKDEKREEILVTQIDIIVSSYGLHFYLQTDPRGASLYVAKQPIDDTMYSTTAEVIA